MSQLPCQCGDTIRDQTDDLPYKAYVLPDQRYWPFMEAVTAEIADYIAARTANKHREWILARFGAQYASVEWSDAIIVNDLIMCRLSDMAGDAYQCVTCGRLHIQQAHRPQHYATFQPVGAAGRHVFDTQNKTNDQAETQDA